MQIKFAFRDHHQVDLHGYIPECRSVEVARKPWARLVHNHRQIEVAISSWVSARPRPKGDDSTGTRKVDNATHRIANLVSGHGPVEIISASVHLKIPNPDFTPTKNYCDGNDVLEVYLSVCPSSPFYSQSLQSRLKP